MEKVKTMFYSLNMFYGIVQNYVHRIGVGSDFDLEENGFVHQDLQAATHFVGMTVPDRIILAGISSYKNSSLPLPPDHHLLFNFHHKLQMFE